MSTLRTQFAAAVSLTISLGSAVAADPADKAPTIGATQTLPVLSVSLAVGGTGYESKRAVYSPPPGWYVRSHRVVVVNRSGAANYAISTVAAGWDWRSGEQTALAGKSNANGTVSAYKVSGGGQFATARDATSTDNRTIASSHHVLVLDASVRGAGFLQSGSSVDLTVMAEMVYLGK